MKPQIKLTFIFIGMFITGIILAQEPLDFFPHHLGDVWEYWLDAGPGGYIIQQNVITKDSLGNDGRYYIETSWFGKFVVDTTTFEVFKLYGTLDKLYKLDADSGDSWIVWEDSSGGAHTIGLAVVVDLFQEIIFNHIVTIKVIAYYDYEIGAPESLWTQNLYLASDFGLVQADVELSAPYYFLRGAIIDSILYGNVTSINKSNKRESSKLPENFTLHQSIPILSIQQLLSNMNCLLLPKWN
jgi:hypothetical protein